MFVGIAAWILIVSGTHSLPTYAGSYNTKADCERAYDVIANTWGLRSEHLHLCIPADARNDH